MQTIGHIFIAGVKILLLIRQGKDCRYLKRRYTGSDGNRFEDEEIFLGLVNSEKRLKELLEGKTICL